jgi:predicted RNase H-like HicB family nuclease
MPLPQSAVDAFEQQQRITLLTVAGARRVWSGMGLDFTASWRVLGPRIWALVAAGQLASARNAAESVPSMVSELGLPGESAGEVAPEALAGTAGDGRDLDGLLYGSVATVNTAVGQGASQQEALEQGQSALDMYVRTALADVAREAAAAAIASHTGVTRYVRMLRPPSCARCAVLAGRTYSWKADFNRHPRCDCVAIPASEATADDMRLDTLGAIKAGQVTGLNRAEVEAITRQGADPFAVINAKRGMTTANIGGRKVRTTLEGTTRRGYANQVRKEIAANRAGLTSWTEYVALQGGRVPKMPRLTVWQIYRLSDDRDEVNRLLAANGYLRPGAGQAVRDVARRAG